VREFEEPFAARWYAIVNCEGQDDSFDDGIVVVLPRKEAANAELARRRALPPEHDDHVDAYHAVLPIHVNGVGWNSHDPCPDDWPNRE
jgi:hypothetical protein